MSANALETCNACDAAPMEPGNPAGYCRACMDQAEAATAGGREAARRLLATAAKVAITIHKTTEREVHLVVAGSAEEAERLATEAADKAMRAGHAVTWPDGRRTWISTEAIWRDGDYVWHEDGDRVRCERKLITMRDGEREERVLSRPWRHYDSVA